MKNETMCLDALLERSAGKTLEQLSDADKSAIAEATAPRLASMQELSCQVDGCTRVQMAITLAGRILVLTSRVEPQHYPCKNGKL